MLFLDRTPDLTETDMIIYRVIVKNMDTVVLMRIRDLAAATYCSTASIQRFCQKFECNGWAEFKVKLQLYKEKQEKRRIYNTDLDSGEVIRAIMAMAEPGAQNDLDQAAQLLADRQQVIWFGCGTSRIVAEFGAITYSSLVNLSLAISDPLNHPVVRYNSETAQDTCVIVCSVSGENRMVINYMSQLITNNVPIIAITNNSDSTIAKMAKLNLSYFATEQKVEGANVTTQTPAIFLIEKLIRRVSSLVHQETAVEPDNIR